VVLSGTDGEKTRQIARKYIITSIIGGHTAHREKKTIQVCESLLLLEHISREHESRGGFLKVINSPRVFFKTKNN
jgi:hypothetical protein